MFYYKTLGKCAIVSDGGFCNTSIILSNSTRIFSLQNIYAVVEKAFRSNVKIQSTTTSKNNFLDLWRLIRFSSQNLGSSKLTFALIFIKSPVKICPWKGEVLQLHCLIFRFWKTKLPTGILETKLNNISVYSTYYTNVLNLSYEHW